MWNCTQSTPKSMTIWAPYCSFSPYCYIGQLSDITSLSDIVYRDQVVVLRGNDFELNPHEHIKRSYLWVTRTVVGRPTALPLLASVASPWPPLAAWRPPGPWWPSSWRLAMFLGCNTCNSSSSRFMSYTSPSNSTDKERVCRVWTNLGLYSGSKGRYVSRVSRCAWGENKITWPDEHFGKGHTVPRGASECRELLTGIPSGRGGI